MKKLLSLLFTLSLQGLQATELKLASYNIKHGYSMNGKVELDKTAAKLAEFDADIIALQEVDVLCQRSGKVDQPKFFGEKLQMHYAFGKFMDYQGGQYGMALLSKFPILEIKKHVLPAGAEPRIALEIIVEPTKGKKASFVCVHFDFTSEELRQPQIKALLKALETTTHPVAIIGDYNTQPNSESIALFNKDWFNVPKKGQNLTFPSVKPRVEIDYFMLRGYNTEGVTATVIEETVVSDHRPLTTKVKLP